MHIFRHQRWFFSLILIASAFAACRIEDVRDDVVFTIEPEFTVDLFEQRDASDGTPVFGLWVESMANYDCPGYGIEADVQVAGGKIDVTLLGVLRPTPCAGDSAPARQFLPIGNLADGVYPFSLSLRDVVTNTGILTAANGHYELSLPDAQGVDVHEFVLEPLPDGIIWGYAATPNEPSEPVADNFIFDLKTLTSESGLAPGYYSYFTVAGTGEVFFHKRIAPAVAAQLFVRRLTATPNDLKSLLQNYRNSSQQPLNIKCWTTEGEL